MILQHQYFQPVCKFLVKYMFRNFGLCKSTIADKEAGNGQQIVVCQVMRLNRRMFFPIKLNELNFIQDFYFYGEAIVFYAVTCDGTSIQQKI